MTPPSSGLPRRVLITGASRGIGAAIAASLLARGVRLAVLGRDRAALEALVAGHPGCALIEADLESEADLPGCVARAAAALGGLDGFVSCAGVVDYAGVGAITPASLRRQAEVNWMAPLLLAQAAAHEIERAGGGAMLLVASTLGLGAAPLTAAYAASKAALISTARSFALELGPSAIRVNAIAPGVVDTGMVRVVRTTPGEAPPSAAEAEQRIDAQLAQLRSLHPLGRLGTVQEIAESALYLLAAPYVTGSIMTVDGGLLLGRGEL